MKKIRVEICKLSAIKEFWCSVCTSDGPRGIIKLSIYTDCYKSTPKESDTEERKYTIVQDARSHLVDQKFWRGIWRPTTGKGYFIVFSARSHLVLLDTWISKIRKYAHLLRMQEVFWSSWHFYNAYAHPQWRKDPHLLRMQEVIWSSRTFEGTLDHPQQRKSIRFCPMSKVIWLSYIFEKTQWSEGPLLLRMWEVISSSRTFEEAHDHWSPTLSVAHWGETTQSFGQAGDLKRHKLINIGEKPHKCKQCDYVTAQIGYLRDHIKMHFTEKPNQCNWCEFSWITKKRNYPTSSHPQ